MTLDWLIIGGGLHGVHVAARLLAQAGVPPERLAILDPGERLLSRWRSATAAVGLSHLRSPSVHNIGLDAGALDRFADQRGIRDPGAFAAPYHRPSLELFNAHADALIDSFDLSALHIRQRARQIEVDSDGVSVRVSAGPELAARNLLLAPGSAGQPAWPSWAPRADPRVEHVLTLDRAAWSVPQGMPVAIVGAGISGAQIALRLVREGHEVHLVSRHELRIHQFDSDPGWLGPMNMTGFNRILDPAKRRSRITEARHRGSVPPEVQKDLDQADPQLLHWHRGEIASMESAPDSLRLHLSNDRILETGRVILATGVLPGRPGGQMLDSLIDRASLPCATCGYPTIDASLRWHPRIRVMGPLAELELGPTSRNIAGARRAADRVLESLGNRTSRPVAAMLAPAPADISPM